MACNLIVLIVVALGRLRVQFLPAVEQVRKTQREVEYLQLSGKVLDRLLLLVLLLGDLEGVGLGVLASGGGRARLRLSDDADAHPGSRLLLLLLQKLIHYLHLPIIGVLVPSHDTKDRPGRSSSISRSLQETLVHLPVISPERISATRNAPPRT